MKQAYTRRAIVRNTPYTTKETALERRFPYRYVNSSFEIFRYSTWLFQNPQTIYCQYSSVKTINSTCQTTKTLRDHSPFLISARHQTGLARNVWSVQETFGLATGPTVKTTQLTTFLHGFIQERIAAPSRHLYHFFIDDVWVFVQQPSCKRAN